MKFLQLHHQATSMSPNDVRHSLGFFNSGSNIIVIRKTCPCIPPYTQLLYSKIWVYRGIYFFFLFLIIQHIDCEYSLEPSIYVLNKIKRFFLIYHLKKKSLYNTWARVCTVNVALSCSVSPLLLTSTSLRRSLIQRVN